MAFMDQAGNVKPVRMEPDGSVPVADDKGANELLAEILLELRAIRVGLEMMHDMAPGGLLDIAALEEDE